MNYSDKYFIVCCVQGGNSNISGRSISGILEISSTTSQMFTQISSNDFTVSAFSVSSNMLTVSFNEAYISMLMIRINNAYAQNDPNA